MSTKNTVYKIPKNSDMEARWSILLRVIREQIPIFDFKKHQKDIEISTMLGECEGKEWNVTIIITPRDNLCTCAECLKELKKFPKKEFPGKDSGH